MAPFRWAGQSGLLRKCSMSAAKVKQACGENDAVSLCRPIGFAAEVQQVCCESETGLRRKWCRFVVHVNRLCCGSAAGLLRK